MTLTKTEASSSADPTNCPPGQRPGLRSDACGSLCDAGLSISLARRLHLRVWSRRNGRRGMWPSGRVIVRNISKPTRRSMLKGAGAALAAPLLATSARAQEWPARPVRVIVPYPPGGGADTVSRIFFTKLSEMMGQQFVIDNRGGAGGTIAAAAAAKADPDGYTILYDATAFSVNPVPLWQAQLRLPEGFPAGVPGLAGGEHPGGDAVGRGQDRRRRDRARQGGARRARLRILRQRHGAAPVAGDVPPRRPAPRSITFPIAAAGRR